MCSYFKDGESALCNQSINKEECNMSENNTENFYFKLKSVDAYVSDLYIEYHSRNETCYETCYIGTTDGVDEYYRDMSYSELVEFSNAVNKVIKMMEANRKVK